MKKSLAVYLTLIALFGVVQTYTSPAHAVSHIMMLQAQDLIHQAWNPGGKTPSNGQRIKLLKEALEVFNNDPGTGYQGHKARAERYVRAAIEQIKLGDPYHKVNDYLQDAVDQCRDALADADNS
jgi:hypothetical protein